MKAGSVVGVAMCVLLLGSGDSQAQNLSGAFSVAKLSYSGQANNATDGDRAVEVGLSFTMATRWRLGGGAFVGKFDTPESDPSFTAVAVFFEVVRVWPIGPRTRSFAGARVAWEHERVGDPGNGLWAYGWSAGPQAGVDVQINRDVALRASFTLLRLDLRRPSASRGGVRMQTAAGVVWTW